MRRPKDVDSVLRIAVDASNAGAEEFLARAGRERAIKEAVFGPWQNAALNTEENRRLVMLGARAALTQYLYEEALVAVIDPMKKRTAP